MATNIIREDVVKLDFEVKGLKEITKMQDEIAEIKKILLGGIGEDEIDKLKDSAKEAKKPLEKIKEETEKVKKSLTDLGKKAAKVAFDGLKKLAGITFKGLIVGVGAAATAIGGLVAKSVSAFADFEQNIGGIQKLFGAGGKTLEEYASNLKKPVDKVKAEYDKLIQAENEVFKNANNSYILGFSANDYMETVTSFSASLISDLKGDTKKAAELSNMAIQDMADNANVFGTDMASVQQVYQGLAKDQYVLLDNLKLGYGGSKEGAKQLVADAAKIDKSIKANDLSFSNMVKAINVIQKDMGIYGATANEAAGTITGSLNATKAAWGNLLIAMSSGENLDQCIDNMVNAVETFGKNVIPVAEKALGGIGTLVEKLSPIIAEKLPQLAETLLPPLIVAAVELVKGLIKALPSIVRTLAQTIVDIFGEQFPIIGQIGNFFKDNANKIANSIKVIIPTVLALVGAFKGFKAIQGIKEMFGGGDKKGGGKGKKGGFLGNLTKTLKELGKTKSTVILKGMANMAIIFGGLVGLTALFMLVAPQLAKIADGKSLAMMIIAVGAIGFVGAKLTEMSAPLGKIPVSQVAKGLLNIGIIVAGMSALFLLIGAVSLIKFDVSRILAIVGIIGALGLVGGILTVFAGIVGCIPVVTVALGLANMAIIIAGMSALFLLIGATSLLNFDYSKIMQIVGIIGVLGIVGGTLTVFAGIVGMIPIPIVLAGLANIGLVLGGMTALIIAFGELTRIQGFTEFLDKGGQVLVKIMNILGQMVGALAGGVIEGLSSCLPALGENLGIFGENIKPLFEAMSGIDMGGVGAFFTALVGLLTVATGNEIVEGIKNFFGGDDESAIAKLGTELTNFASNSKGFFETVNALPDGSFDKGKQLFECLAKVKELPPINEGGTTSLSAIATELGSFDSKAGGFFTSIKEYDLDKVNQLWASLGGADTVTSEAIKNINSGLDDIIKKVSALPKKMADGIKKSGGSLSEALVSIWKQAVTACATPINKLISGANWVLKEFGSSKSLLKWTPYAKGTNGHKGGNALVNDGRGAELVQMPNGNTFIPKGKNVFIPNAPKGMKVLSAEQTAQMFGKKTPTFRYADGTGGIDIWSYMDNSKGLIDSVKNKYVSYDGVKGIALSIGQGMVNTVSGEMVAWADKLFDEFGALSLEDYVPSKGVEQWRSTVIRALKMEGLYSEANVARTLMQMQTESSGNPRAINLWDINAKNGTPSKGLMQVIDPTFKTYARAGFNTNIYDPLSNILASIRYAVSRYGSLAKAYRGVGYENGGLVTKTGMIAENPLHPEWVIPTDPSKRNRALSLYRQAGQSLGLSSYTPESGAMSNYGDKQTTEYNTYSPVFNLTISGSNDDRTMERKVKRWISEAMDEVFDSMARKSPRLREV